MLTLYGCKGCGSVVVEVMLRLCGEPFTTVLWDWDDEGAWSKFALLSAQRQVPTLVLDDGNLMTESAAIIFWLLNRFPASPLIPQDHSQKAQMFRWLVYQSVNIYGPIGIRDFPERWIEGEESQELLAVGATKRQLAAWTLMENELAGTPFLLGDTMSALDVYSAMLCRWRPGPKWIEEHCPKVARAVAATQAHPVVAEIFANNFGGGN